jgi:hypothetical protein
MLRVLVVAALVVLSACTESRTDSRASISGQVQLDPDVDGLNDMSRVRVDLGRGEGGVAPDEEGNFEISDLEPDVYEVQVIYSGGLTATATRSAYVRYKQRVVARAGAAVNMGIIPLEVAKGRITGTVTVVGNGSPDGTVITVLTEKRETLTATVENGTFAVEGVTVGNTTLTAQKPGFASQTACTSVGQVTEEEEVVVLPPLTLMVPEISWTPGGTIQAALGTQTWYLLRDATQVTINFSDSPWARLARIWTDRDDGGQPAYGAFQSPVVRPVLADRTVVSMQFSDGCGYESPLYTLTVVRDGAPPVVQFVQLHGGAAQTNTGNVEMVVAAVDDQPGQLKMTWCQVGEDCAETLDANQQDHVAWQDYAPRSQVTLRGLDGQKAVRVWVKDYSGNISGAVEGSTQHTPVTASITLDTLPPTVRLVAPAETNTPVVWVEAIPEPLHDAPAFMQWGFLSDVSAEPMRLYAPGFSVMLPPGDGTRTLYARFHDAAGNPSVANAEAEILVDTTPPAAPTVVLAGGSAWTNQASVPLSVTVPGESTLARWTLRLAGDLTDVQPSYEWGFWPTNVILTAGDGEKRVSVSVVDAAGNESPLTRVAITLDSQPPNVRSITFAGAVTVGNSGLYTRNSDVQLVVDLVSGGLGATSMWLACDGSFDGEPDWVPYSAGRARCLGVTPDGQHTIALRFRDEAGNATSDWSGVINVDTAPPWGHPEVLNLIQEDGRRWVETRKPTLILTTRDVAADGVTAGSGVTEMKLWRDGASPSSVPWEPVASSRLWPTDLPLGRNQICMQLRDAVGNPSDTDCSEEFSVVLAGFVLGTVALEFGEDNSAGVEAVLVDPTRLTTSPADGGVADGGGAPGPVFDPCVAARDVTDGGVPVHRAVVGVATSQAGGDFQLENVEAGAYELHLCRTHYVTQMRPVTVRTARGTSVGTVRMGKMRGFLFGQVAVEEATDNGGVTVELQPGARTTTSSPQGAYRLEDVPFGDYTLRLTKAGYNPAPPLAITVATEQGTEVSFVSLPKLNPGMTVMDVLTPGNPYYTRYTASRTVKLSLTPPRSPGLVCAAESDAFTSTCGSAAGMANYRAYTESLLDAFPLTSPGDGVKSVRVRFLDDRNTPILDAEGSTTLDTGKPAVTRLVVNGGNRYINRAANTGSVALVIHGSDDAGGSGVARYRVKFDSEATWGGWLDPGAGPVPPFSAPPPYDLSVLYLPAGVEGLKPVSVQLMDRAGNVSDVTADAQGTVEVDTTPPTGCAMTVDDVGTDGVKRYVRTRDVSVTVGTCDATAVQLSNSPATGFQVPSTRDDGKLDWLLTSGDGDKTAYGRFCDDAGNCADRSSTITLDTQPPTGVFLRLNDGHPYAADGSSVPVELRASGASWYAISADTALPEQWTALGSSPLVMTQDLGVGDGPRRMYAWFKDAAGNVSGRVDGVVTVDSKPPEAVVVTVGDGSGFVSDAGGTVYLSVVCVDQTTPASDLTLTVVSGGGETWYDGYYRMLVPLLIGTTDGAFSLTVTCTDGAGHALDAAPESFVLDTQGPTGTLSARGLQGTTAPFWLSSGNVTFTMQGTDPSPGSSVTGMKLWRSTENEPGTWAPFRETLEWGTVLAEGSYQFSLKLQDGAGNASTQAITVAFDVMTSGPVTGRVVDETSAALVGAEVRLTNALAQAQSAFSLGDGTFQFTGVQAGGYTVTTSKTGYSSDVRFKEVVARSGLALGDVTLVIARGAVCGTVELEGERTHAGVTATLLPGGLRGSSFDDGTFCVQAAPVGTYASLVISKQGFSTTTIRNVVVRDGAQTDVGLSRLTKISSTVVVRDDTADNPFPLQYTQARRVYLSITPPDPHGLVCYAESAGLEARCGTPPTNYENFQEGVDVPFDITSAGDGEKTIAVQFLDDGGGTRLDVLAGVTLLDSRPPLVNAVVLNGGEAYINRAQNTGQVTVSMDAQEDASAGQDVAVSGLYQYRAKFADAPGFGSWQAYAGSVPLPYTPAGDGVKTVTVQFRDRAGNVSLDSDVKATDSITVDTTPPAGVGIAFIDGVVQDGETRYIATERAVVTVTMGGAVSVMLSNTGTFDGQTAQVPSGGKLVWFLDPGDGEKEVTARFFDVAGNVNDGTVAAKVWLDTRAPTGVRITVNGGVAQSNSTTTVPVVLTATGAARYALQESPDFSGATWLEFTGSGQSVNFPLGGVQGLHTIYGRFQDVVGNESAVVSGTVTIDTTAPTLAQVRINNGATYTNNATVQVELLAEGSPTHMNVGCDGVLAPSGWVTFSPVTTCVLSSLSQGRKTVVAQVRDGALNTSDQEPAFISLDTLRPTITSFTLNGGTANEPTNNPSVVAHITASDATSGLSAMALSQTSMDCDVATYNLPPVATYPFPLQGSDGTFSLYVCLVDAAGNKSAAVQPSANAVKLDRTAPSAPRVTLGAGTGWATDETVNLGVTTSDGDTTGYTFHLDGDVASAPRSHAYGSIPATITLAGSTPGRTVYAWLTDAAGNRSTTTMASVTVDEEAPTAVISQVADGSGYVTVANGVTTADIECYDNLSVGSQLTLTVKKDDDTLYSGIYLRVVTLAVGTAQGWKTIIATCTDAASNSSTADDAEFLHDHTPPAVNVFTLNGGQPAEPTNSTYLSVSFDVSDEHSHPAGVTLAESAIACSGVGLAYLPTDPSKTTFTSPAGGLTFPITPGDDTRSLYMCARDQAGNTTSSAVGSTNTVRLDTVAPSKPAVRISSGSGWVQSGEDVPVTFTTTDSSTTGYKLFLFGDITKADAEECPENVGCLDLAWESRPGALTFTTGAGNKNVYGYLQDPAGNQSEMMASSVSVDLDPPYIDWVTVADGNAYVTHPTGSTSVAVSCYDSPADQSLLRLELRNAVGDVVYNGPYRSYLSVSLGAAEGANSVSAKCTDPSGRDTTADPVSVYLDHSKPVISSFTITTTSPTNNPQIELALDAADVHSGLAGIALGTSSMDCGAAWYQEFPPPDWPIFYLPYNSATYTVYVCLRDVAGNVTDTARATSNTIVLDTIPPSAGTILLANGASAIRDVGNVALTLSGGATGMAVELTGDLAAPMDPFLWQDRPPTVALSDTGDGPRSVFAVLYDPAGNPSAPFMDEVWVDQTPPQLGMAELAGGAATTRTRTVNVSLFWTDARFMYLWESADNTCTTDMECGAMPFKVFSPNTTYTLAPVTGDHFLCWKYCDELGNGAVTNAPVSIRLEHFRPRLSPVLDSISPESYVALSAGTHPLTLTGDFLTDETYVQVGDFRFACDQFLGNLPNTDCSQEYSGSCAQTCVVDDLPGWLLARAGTYVVRLVSPDPMAGGESNESVGFKFFSVESPVPVIESIDHHGVVQPVDDTGRPVAQTVTVGVCGSRVTENAQFILGSNQGTRLAPPDPLPTCPFGGSYHRVRFTTEGLLPADLVDKALSVVNPSPGGGTASVPFGINPTKTACPANGRCVSNLRRTRAPLAGGDGLAQGFAFSGFSAWGAMGWSGGTAARVEGRSGTTRQLLARYLDESTSSVIPLPFWTPTDRVVLEDDLGTGPLVNLKRAAKVANGTFVPSMALPAKVADLPGRVVLGDLTGDGALDLVVLDEAAETVTVCVADSSPFYLDCSRVYPVAADPRGLALADFNMDGRLDVLVGAYTGDAPQAGFDRLTSTVYLGLGAGNLGERVDRPLGAGCEAVAAADFNGDGAADVACGSFQEDKVYVRLGRGDGLFAVSTVTTPLQGTPWDLAVGDVNGDGKQDVVTVSHVDGSPDPVGTVEVCEGVGDGTFTNCTVYGSVGKWPSRLVLADVDADGALDVVATDQNYGNVWLGWNLGDGTFGATWDSILLGAQPSSVDVGDLNGDGYPDLVLTSATLDRVDMRFNDGSRGFASFTSHSVGDYPFAVALGDVNADGVTDIVTSNRYGQNVSILMGQGVNTWGDARRDTVVSGVPTDLARGDFNRDGAPDFATAQSDGNGTVTRGQLDGRFFITSTPYVGHGPHGLVAADVDGDGLADLVAGTEWEPAGFVWLKGDGAGEFAAPTTVDMGAGTQGVAVGDLDNDGRVDVVCSGTDSTVRVAFGIGSGAFFFPRVELAVGTGPLTPVLGDVDNSGTLDIVVANSTGSSVSVWRSNGDRTFQASPPIALPSSPEDLTLDDLDGDGAMDIALVRSGSTTVLLRGNGNGTFRTAEGQYVEMADRGAHVIHTSDMNGDGFPDFMTFNDGLGDMYLWLGTGTRTFPPNNLVAPVVTASPPGTQVHQFTAMDVNLDRTPDLVMAASNPEQVSAYLLPGPSAVAQVLTDMPAASVVLPPDQPGWLRVHQASQVVDQLSVRVRLVGVTGFDGVRVFIVSPRGETVMLASIPEACGPVPVGNQWAFTATQATACGTLGSTHGLQPDGDWELQVTGGTDVGLEDFAVITHGSHRKASPGTSPSTPEVIRWTSETLNRVLRGTTLGFPDNAALACAPTHHETAGLADGPGDHFYQLTIPGAVNRDLTVRVVANFDSVVEVRSGSCASLGGSLGCNDDTGLNSHSRVVLNGRAPGTYCIVVDGFFSDPRRHSGDFDLYVRLD